MSPATCTDGLRLIRGTLPLARVAVGAQKRALVFILAGCDPAAEGLLAQHRAAALQTDKAHFVVRLSDAQVLQRDAGLRQLDILLGLQNRQSFLLGAFQRSLIASLDLLRKSHQLLCTGDQGGKAVDRGRGIDHAAEDPPIGRDHSRTDANRSTIGIDRADEAGDVPARAELEQIGLRPTPEGLDHRVLRDAELKRHASGGH